MPNAWAFYRCVIGSFLAKNPEPSRAQPRSVAQSVHSNICTFFATISAHEKPFGIRGVLLKLSLRNEL